MAIVDLQSAEKRDVTSSGASGFETLLSLDQAVLDALPSAVSVCAADGVIVRYNRRAVELWGRAPRYDERFAGSLLLYRSDGRSVAPPESPMALVLATGEPARDEELVIQRPDGSRISVLINIEPYKNSAGNVLGAISSFQDISHRKSSEKRLAESEQRYRALLEALPAAVYTTDADGRITFYNQAAVEMSGRTPQLGSDKWCVTWRLYNNDGTPLPHDECPMAVALKEQRPVRGAEAWAERPDGTRVPFMPLPTPLYDADGNFAGALNVLVDISERKHTEEALKTSEESLAKRAAEQSALYKLSSQVQHARSVEQIYDSALDAILATLHCSRASILLFDEANVMRFAAWRGLSDAYRAAVERHSPWTPEAKDPVPVTIENIAASDLSAELKGVMEREGISALAFIPLVANGRLIGKFMSYYAAPHRFSDDEIELALAFARHVAFGVARTRGQEARRIAQEALARNEERLRLATQSGKIGIWEWHLGSNRMSWTDSLYAIHGVKKDEFETTVESCNALVHEDDRDRVLGTVSRGLNEDVPYEFEYRAVRPDGQAVWLYTNAIVLKEGGKPLRMLGATLDMTDRKEAEAEREFLVAELNHRVKNTLATVISIAHQSFRDRGPAIDEARRSFDARIRALAQTHSRLADTNWLGVPFEKMLADEIAPYAHADGGNVRLNGPRITLTPKCAVTLGMAIHELTTNAAKHGAFTAKNGAVDVGWEMDRKEKQLRIKWIESGGPVVEPPKRSGFGRLLLERALASDLKGKVELNFAREGLKCTIAFPLDEPSAAA